MEQVPLGKRWLAAAMHVLSLFLTFFLPLAVYFLVRKKSSYFTFHAKEGLNLHFTFFPIFIILTRILAKVWPFAATLALLLILLETVLILIAAIFAVMGKKFSYPVIRYFKTE
ncbi:putative Tic20 family protein [Sporosarcina luteola]|nr:putative Tic20 family protein [Sporosarcina luteola]